MSRLLQVSMTAAASDRERKHSILWHSPRNFPLNPSSVPFCHGRAMSLRDVSTLKSESQRSVGAESNSGPLSERRHLGAPWTATGFARTSMTRPERMLPATSAACASRVLSSTTVRYFRCFPLAQASKANS